MLPANGKWLKGKWKSLGGDDVKILKSEGEGEYIIKWHGPRSRKLVIQSDNAEENIKSKFENLINWGPNNANSLYEASVRRSLKADIASLVDITSDLITQVHSMRSKQKDFESVTRKQDIEGCKLREENLLLTSSLLPLEIQCTN